MMDAWTNANRNLRHRRQVPQQRIYVEEQDLELGLVPLPGLVCIDLIKVLFDLGPEDGGLWVPVDDRGLGEEVEELLSVEGSGGVGVGGGVELTRSSIMAFPV